MYLFLPRFPSLPLSQCLCVASTFLLVLLCLESLGCSVKKLLWVLDLVDGGSLDLLLTHGTSSLRVNQGLELGKESGKVAGWAVGPIVGNHAKTSSDAVRYMVLTLRAVEGTAGRLHGTVWARSDWLVILLLGGLADDAFDLLFVSFGNLRAILWPHQHACILERGLFEVCSLALNHCRSQDRYQVLGELGNVLGCADEHAGRCLVVSLLYEYLDENVAVKEHQSLLKLARYGNVARVEIPKHVIQHLVCNFVVAELLHLLPSNQDRSPRRLPVVAECCVELVDKLGILGGAIVLPHQVVNKGVCQNLVPCQPNHFDRLLHTPISHRQKEFEGWSVLSCPLIKLGCLLGLLLGLVVLRHGNVLVLRAVVVHEMSIRVHQIMRLRKLRCLLVLLGDNEKLDGRPVIPLPLAILCDVCCALD
mmetsp:Transcript_22188/g.55624  ORF Transcript_22188/g.55624 Transcript_22188/m.55624 type:complete len:420 (+) Transcript_22188:80-1339(+)